MAERLVSDEFWARVEPVIPVVQRRYRYRLLAELNAQGGIDWSTGVVDGSSERAVFGGLTPARPRSIARRMASRLTL
jgi:hypothetical protein